jgi:hypothetical protein
MASKNQAFFQSDFFFDIKPNVPASMRSLGQCAGPWVAMNARPC